MSDFVVIKLTDIRDQGGELFEVSQDALMYLVQNGQSHVIKWSTLLNLVSTDDQPGNDNSSVIQLQLGGDGGVQQTFNVGQLVEKIIVFASGSSTVTCGTTQGGTDIFSSTVESGQAPQHHISRFMTSQTTYYFGGSNATVYIYVR